MAELTDAQSRLIDEAAAASAGPASLSDIQHVVILMQENRSFDHYFGTLSGVRGFSDPNILASSWAGRATRSSTSSATSRAQGADAGRLPAAVPAVQRPAAAGRPDHQRHLAHLADPAPELERRRDGQVRGHPRRRRRRRARPGHHGLLHPRRPALLLRAGGRVHRVRRLLQLGDRPDRLEPADGHVGHHRPGRDGRRPGGRDVRQPDRGVRQAELGDDAGTAAGRRGELEGLQRPALRAGAEPAALLQGLHRPVLGHRRRTGRPRPDPGLPGRLRRRRAGGTSCRRCRGSCRRWRSASTPPRRPATART